MPRTILPFALLCMLLLQAGCAPHETYGDRALPEAGRARIEGYSRYQVLYFEDLQIVSVDGQREGGQTGWPYASSVSIPAGEHWLQILLLRNSSDIAMCAFEGTFDAGRRYELERVGHEQALLAHSSSPRFRASISMRVTGRSAPPRTVNVAAECGKAPHCRQSSDCPASYGCERDPGFDFGRCVQR